MSQFKEILESLSYIQSIIPKLKNVEKLLNNHLETEHNYFESSLYPWIETVHPSCSKQHKKNEPPKLLNNWYSYTPERLEFFLTNANITKLEVAEVMGYNTSGIITKFLKPFTDTAHRDPPHNKWCKLIESKHAVLVEMKLAPKEGE